MRNRVATRKWARLAIGVLLAAIAVTAFTGVWPTIRTATFAADSVAVPAPDVDEPVPAGSASETVVLAGGCFWGVQGVFQHVEGVTRAESGYAGGDRETANYETVSTGDTGHAESVQVTYDPNRVTLGQLLRVYFSVVQDPTQLNRQGPDHGTQYRSVIFAHDATQKRVAESYIAQLNRAGVFGGPIVTSVSPKSEFYPAERYHQDYLNSNPLYPYIAINDMPKVDALKQAFPDLYRDQPVLILADGA